MSQINVDTIRSREGIAPSLDKGVIVTGVATATEGYFSGNVTIGGTLTYEDVTNQDVIGLITARSGIKIGNDQDSTGIGITLGTGDIGSASFAGIVTAATCIKVGDGTFGVGIGATILGNGNAVFSGITTSSSFVGNITGDVTGDATGLSGTPDITVGKITGTAVTFSGITTAAGGLQVTGTLVEAFTSTTTAYSSSSNIDISNANLHFGSANLAGTNNTLNIISNTGINTDITDNEVLNVTVITAVNASTAFVDKISIDGKGVGITTHWVGGSAPTDGGSAGVDTYSFNILKTGSETYVVVANQIKTS